MKGSIMRFPQLFRMIIWLISASVLGCTTDLSVRNGAKLSRFTGPIVHRDFLVETEIILSVFDKITQQPIRGVSVYNYTTTDVLGETDAQGKFKTQLPFFGGDTVSKSRMHSSQYNGEIVCLLILKHVNYRDATVRLNLANDDHAIVMQAVYMELLGSYWGQAPLKDRIMRTSPDFAGKPYPVSIPSPTGVP